VLTTLAPVGCCRIYILAQLLASVLACSIFAFVSGWGPLMPLKSYKELNISWPEAMHMWVTGEAANTWSRPTELAQPRTPSTPAAQLRVVLMLHAYSAEPSALHTKASPSTGCRCLPLRHPACAGSQQLAQWPEQYSGHAAHHSSVRIDCRVYAAFKCSDVLRCVACRPTSQASAVQWG
jgi:hypothetical protein